MRKDVEFNSKELRCRGWLYVPDDLPVGRKAPAVVMAHGFTAVKEQVLPEFAERFAAAGFVTMVFDYRHFGESEGEPRGQLFPLEMVEDYRNAITWVSDQPEVDPNRICLWGTSYSGGLVIYAGTTTNACKRLSRKSLLLPIQSHGVPWTLKNTNLSVNSCCETALNVTRPGW